MKSVSLFCVFVLYRSVLYDHRNCGLTDPTWSELRHYVYFLSNQLTKVERSPFCTQAFADDLPGFRAFVIDFMFRMAKVSLNSHSIEFGIFYIV